MNDFYFKDVCRLVYFGYEYHSSDYNLRKNSRSCYCMLKLNSRVYFCEIVSFDIEKSRLVVNSFVYISFVKFIFQNTSHRSVILEMLNSFDSFNPHHYVIIDKNDFILKSFPISSIICRCLMYNLHFFGVQHTLMSSLIEHGEHL